MFFHNPVILILLPVVLLIVLYANKRNASAGFRFSSGELLSGLRSSCKVRLSARLIFLRLAAYLLIIIALTRPQSPIADSKVRSEGIDIVLAIDCSTSMLAEDFKAGDKRINRLDVVKEVVKDFINGRKDDRIGVVAFSARPYIISPLTLDYGWLIQNLDRIKAGMIEDGTAIGSGIAASLNRLKDTKAKSKIVILLTDGRNNAGKIPPLTAAHAAKALKIKVYTIGAGAKGLAPYPAYDLFGNKVYQMVSVDIDEDALQKIASLTNAKYYRATGTESLKKIYSEIDKLEKSPIEEKGYSQYNELFIYFLIPALIILLLEIILSNTLLRKIP